MTTLTANETIVLRQTLGLGYYNRKKPIRNHLSVENGKKYQDVIYSLVLRGLLKQDMTYDAGGRSYFYTVTDAGREAVLEQSWPE